MTYPDGTSSEVDYIVSNLPGVVKDRSGRRSYYDYDPMKRLSRVQDAQGNTLQMDYDSSGNMTRLLDAKGNQTKWAYDALNRVTQKAYHDGTTEAFAYAGGLISQTKGARGQVVRYSYDDNSNVSLIDYPNMADVWFAYNKLDDVTQVINGIGTHTFAYDNFGRSDSLDGPFANDGQNFVYDALQRLQSQSVGRGASGGTQSQSYAYDALERLTSLTASAGNSNIGTFGYSYVGNTDLLSLMSLPNGSSVEQSYDALQRLTGVVNRTGTTNLARYAYSYDTRDVRTGMQSQHASDPLKQINYAYDAVDQLTGEQASGGAAGSAYTNSFQYDSMGNRTRQENTKGGVSSVARHTPNALNQLTALSSQVGTGARQTSGFVYDVGGNLTEQTASDGSKTLYSYDDADRLSRIEWRSSTGTPQRKSEFRYDYASRRSVSAEFTWTAGAWVQQAETRRVFDGMDSVQERNAANEVTASYARDGNIAGVLSRTAATGTSFFHYDGSGNVVALSDEQGALAGRYSYDAFGNTLEVVGTRAQENPFRFSTKELHGASGLVDFGYRFYSPGTGRWINRDPIGEDGGLNIYAMVGNSPTNDVDEYGLKKRTPFQRFFWNMGDYLEGRGKGLLGHTARGAADAAGAYALRGTGGRAAAPARAVMRGRIATASGLGFSKWTAWRPLSSLSKQVRQIHSALPKQGSYAWMSDKCVSMRQLRTLTQHTGDEYTMFSLGSQRLVIRGQGNTVNASSKAYDQILKVVYGGGRYAGHTHPPGYSLRPGLGDEPFLRSFGQKKSGIWGDDGWDVYHNRGF